MSQDYVIVSPKYRKVLNLGARGWCLLKAPSPAAIHPDFATHLHPEDVVVPPDRLDAIERGVPDDAVYQQWFVRVRAWLAETQDDPDRFIADTATDVAEGYRDAGAIEGRYRRRLKPGWSWSSTYDDDPCPYEAA